MSLQKIKDAIAAGKMSCPSCSRPIRQFEKYVDMIESAYDGPGSSLDAESSAGSKVTLICGNDGCSWRERTQYWLNYMD